MKAERLEPQETTLDRWLNSVNLPQENKNIPELLKSKKIRLDLGKAEIVLNKNTSFDNYSVILTFSAHLIDQWQNWLYNTFDDIYDAMEDNAEQGEAFTVTDYKKDAQFIYNSVVKFLEKEMKASQTQRKRTKNKQKKFRIR